MAIIYQNYSLWMRNGQSLKVNVAMPIKVYANIWPADRSYLTIHRL